MSNERIDLQWLLEEDGLMQDLNWSIARFEQVEKLVKEMTAELKKMYAREDELLNALRIIRDDLDDQPTGPNADLFEHINKIRNFANDASQ